MVAATSGGMVAGRDSEGRDLEAVDEGRDVLPPCAQGRQQCRTRDDRGHEHQRGRRQQSSYPAGVEATEPNAAAVTQLAELKRMVADVPVAATMISKLEVGETVSIKLPSTPPTEVQGVIHTINPLPSANMTHNVEVQFDNPTMLLLAGQPAEVRFQRP